MINPEQLVLVVDLAKLIVDHLRRLQVVTDRLLDHHPRLLGAATGGPQVSGYDAIHGRRGGHINNKLIIGVITPLVEHSKCIGFVKIQNLVIDPLQKGFGQSSIELFRLYVLLQLVKQLLAHGLGIGI